MTDSANDAEPPWLWEGKLTPPQMLLETVRRGDLLDRIDDYRHASLILLTAPPGFGKTTLLAQWRQELQRRTPAQLVAWLSLDEADNTPGRFLPYLLAALEKAGIRLEDIRNTIVGQTLDLGAERVVSLLIKTLAEQRNCVTLMLDDYHRAASPAIDQILSILLERGNPWIKLVVSARVRPNWPLAALKARGLAHEINSSDLILSLSETSRIVGPQIDPNEISIIHSKTEGWAVLVQLARIWLARASGSSEHLKVFSGQVSEIAQYLAEQIIANLPPDCRQFMQETSQLEYFNVELADHVCAHQRSSELLQQLAPYDTLLVPLDEQKTWFRYHLLLKDFLSPALPAARAREIHRRAAGWLAHKHDWTLAVRHAYKADDQQLALTFLLQAGGWKLVLYKGIMYTHSLLQQFDDASLRSTPQLLLMQSYLNAKQGERALAMELLHRAQSLLAAHAGQHSDEYVIRSLVLMYFDHREVFREFPVSAEQLPPDTADDPLAQAALLCMGAISALSAGHTDNAISAAQAARVRMKMANCPLGENYCLMHWAQALSIAGQLSAAGDKIDEAWRLAEQNFGTDSSLKDLVACFKARHLYCQGQWQEAARLFDSAQDTLEHVDGWFEVYATVAETRWRIALRQDGLEAAGRLLDQTDQLAVRRSLPRLACLAGLWRIDLLVQSDLLGDATNLAQQTGLETLLNEQLGSAGKNAFDWRLLESVTISLARLQIARGQAKTAAVHLQKALTLLSDKGLQRSVWRIGLMLLLARRRSSSPPDAAEIQACINPLLEQHAGGLIMEAGPSLLALLRSLPEPRPARLNLLISELHRWQTHPAQEHQQFSDKGRRVLILLAQGQSNKMIARALDISENTVKFHLKQIFQKLGVENRSAAVSAALRSGILQQTESSAELPPQD